MAPLRGAAWLGVLCREGLFAEGAGGTYASCWRRLLCGWIGGLRCAFEAGGDADHGRDLLDYRYGMASTGQQQHQAVLAVKTASPASVATL